jgi:hypothetical protein
LRVEKSDVRVCDLILGSPSSQIRLANRLEEAIVRLWAEQAARWEVNAELEALRHSAARIQDLVLKRVNGTSSLVASLSSTTEPLEECIDVMDVNGVHWGTRSTMAAALSHFPELGTDLELLGSGHNADLTEDQVDAL